MLVEKGYRWATVNGPYGCATEQAARRVTSRRTDLTELHLMEDGGPTISFLEVSLG
jgi:hypothetical protein